MSEILPGPCRSRSGNVGPKRSRLLIVSDGNGQGSVSAAFRGSPDFEIVRQCGSVFEAVAVLRCQPADLVLLDHSLGPECCSDFIPAARDAGFDGAVVVCAAGLSDPEGAALFQTGASAIWLVEEGPAALIERTRLAAAGITCLPQRFFQFSDSRQVDVSLSRSEIAAFFAAGRSFNHYVVN